MTRLTALIPTHGITMIRVPAPLGLYRCVAWQVVVLGNYKPVIRSMHQRQSLFQFKKKREQQSTVDILICVNA